MVLPYTAGRTRNYTKRDKTLSTTVCKMASADVTLDVRMFCCKPHDLQRVPQHNQRSQVCLHAISIVAIYPARTTVVDNDISESGAGRVLSIETATTGLHAFMRAGSDVRMRVLFLHVLARVAFMFAHKCVQN